MSRMRGKQTADATWIRLWAESHQGDDGKAMDLGFDKSVSLGKVYSLVSISPVAFVRQLRRIISRATTPERPRQLQRSRSTNT
jgi:hypothetical protein